MTMSPKNNLWTPNSYLEGTFNGNSLVCLYYGSDYYHLLSGVDARIFPGCHKRLHWRWEKLTRRRLKGKAITGDNNFSRERHAKAHTLTILISKPTPNLYPHLYHNRKVPITVKMKVKIRGRF